MDTQRFPGYPEHAEPTESAAEFDREEKPRVGPWTYVGGGLILLLFLAIVMPMIWIQFGPDRLKANPAPKPSAVATPPSSK
jgi:hypothetical protein